LDPNADEEQQADASSGGSAAARRHKYLSCADSVQARGGLVAHSVVIKATGNRLPLADIAVSGVPGWCTL
jgi:hypothetical protein